VPRTHSPGAPDEHPQPHQKQQVPGPQ
jgi:hypothetical protein